MLLEAVLEDRSRGKTQYENGPEICSKVGNWKFQLGPLDEVYISTSRISANEPIIRVLTDIN